MVGGKNKGLKQTTSYFILITFMGHNHVTSQNLDSSVEAWSQANQLAGGADPMENLEIA